MPDSDRVETDPCPARGTLVTKKKTLAKCQRFFVAHVPAINAVVAGSIAGCFLGILVEAYTAATVCLVVGHLGILAMLVAANF